MQRIGGRNVRLIPKKLVPLVLANRAHARERVIASPLVHVGQRRENYGALKSAKIYL